PRQPRPSPARPGPGSNRSGSGPRAWPRAGRPETATCWAGRPAVYGRRSPAASRSACGRLASTAGYGGQDGHVVAVCDLGGQATQEPDVLVVQVHVDEPAKLAFLDEAPAQPRVPAVQVAEQLVQRLTAAVDGLLTARVRTQDGRDLDLDG